MLHPANQADSEQVCEMTEIDGKQRPIHDADGDLIADGDFDKLCTFWRWFGDSVHVDECGRPLVVYHGTSCDFEEFDPELAGSNYPDSVGGFFFTDDLVAAQAYADDTADHAGGSPVVFRAYLKIEQPYCVKVLHTNPDRYFDKNSHVILDRADDEGCDAVIVASEYNSDEGQKMLLVFLPTQVLSVNAWRNLNVMPNAEEMRSIGRSAFKTHP
jgi:hypothetical protein